MMNHSAPHTFHIPVLGLCFSIDTPLKVARYGISSVVSIIEDGLIEDMRAYHSLKNAIPYTPITEKEEDYRALRITAYLNMMQDIVAAQIAELRSLPFSGNNDLINYFKLLPEDASLKAKFHSMSQMTERPGQLLIQEELRSSILPGSIDVNIMAKVDNPRYTKDGEKMPDMYSDALSALRGYANSKLSSSVVFSAGYNPRLYSYAEQFEDFFPNESGVLRKKIILKVSDYRSALVQGKIFAKKGLWVSEFRVESGLNCGGHAFATDGLLLGPILEEFKINRSALAEELFALCNTALQAKDKPLFQVLPEQKVTAQGGIGNADEQSFLLEYFHLDSIGWGSPFLLVPEATNVDDATLQQLAAAKKEDYYLSDASPLGVPFNNFGKSSSEAQRKARIEKNRAGSPCYKKYLSSNTEFTVQPICTASRKFIALKELQIKNSDVFSDDIAEKLEQLAEKDCLCEGLTSSVRLKNEMYLPHKLSAVAICPGPNLAYFSGVFTLKQMVDHIYGRLNINNDLARPNMFINELILYIEYLKKQVVESSTMSEKQAKYFQKFKDNLFNGIKYYKELSVHYSQLAMTTAQWAHFEQELIHVPI